MAHCWYWYGLCTDYAYGMMYRADNIFANTETKEDEWGNKDSPAVSLKSLDNPNKIELPTAITTRKK